MHPVFAAVAWEKYPGYGHGERRQLKRGHAAEVMIEPARMVWEGRCCPAYRGPEESCV